MEVNELIREYNRAGGYNDLSYRRTRADDVRFCSWAGQDDDGKKHQNNDNSSGKSPSITTHLQMQH